MQSSGEELRPRAKLVNDPSIKWHRNGKQRVKWIPNCPCSSRVVSHSQIMDQPRAHRQQMGKQSVVCTTMDFVLFTIEERQEARGWVGQHIELLVTPP